jgi:hypothetical protein
MSREARNRQQELFVMVDARLAADAPLRHRVRRDSDPLAPARLAGAKTFLLARRQSPDSDRRLSARVGFAGVEYLAEKFPDKRIWPTDGDVRARARSVSAEMHSGFASLRSHMPLNCRASRPGAGRGPGVEEDIGRVCEIWRECRSEHGGAGRFLFGDFSAADVMFAPVVSRFQTYGVELDREEAAYAQAVLALPVVEEWIAAARREPWGLCRSGNPPCDPAGSGRSVADRQSP